MSTATFPHDERSPRIADASLTRLNDFVMERIMHRSARHSWKMVLLAAPLFAFTAPAKPHTHVDPDGQQVSWYPRECCHEGDCRPVVSIAPDPSGLWMTLMDGYTVFVGPRD